MCGLEGMAPALEGETDGFRSCSTGTITTGCNCVRVAVLGVRDIDAGLSIDAFVGMLILLGTETDGLCCIMPIAGGRAEEEEDGNVVLCAPVPLLIGSLLDAGDDCVVDDGTTRGIGRSSLLEVVPLVCLAGRPDLLTFGKGADSSAGGRRSRVETELEF